MTYRNIADQGVTIFVSRNGGASWRPTLIVGNGAADEAVEFGNGGDAYVELLHYMTPSAPDHDTYTYWSPDGGQTWNKRETLPWIDYPQLAVDRTNGPTRGRLYLLGLAAALIDDLTGPATLGDVSALFRSDDQARHFEEGRVVHYPE